ncbi:unnamed protein product [Phaeothamnion confervicola]
MSSGGSGASSGASGDDPYKDSGSRYGRIELPNFGSGIDLGTVAPMYGQVADYEPEYLDYDIKGKDLFAKCTINIGFSYLSGIGIGGAYGMLEGLRTAPSKRLRIKVNSVMNASGKRGSRLGNAGGVLSLFYTLAEHGLDRLELDQRLGGGEYINPTIAAAATGMLYKSTANPRTMLLAGAVGAASAGVYYIGKRFVGNAISAGPSRSYSY